MKLCPSVWIFFVFFLSIRSAFCLVFVMHRKTIDLNVENQHKHNWGGEGAHCITTFFFRRGCATMRPRLAEISSFKRNMWNFITAQQQKACRDFVPMLEQPTRTALHFGIPGARQARQVLFDARPGRSWRRVLPAQRTKSSTATAMSFASRCASEERATKGQFGRNSSAHMYSYTIIYFKPVSPVSSAPCTRCGRLGASKEKKSVGSWFHAESASPFGGELSWKYYFIIFIWY